MTYPFEIKEGVSQIGKYTLYRSEDGIMCFVPGVAVGSGQLYNIDINKLMFSSIESQLTPENLIGTLKGNFKADVIIEEIKSE